MGSTFLDIRFLVLALINLDKNQRSKNYFIIRIPIEILQKNFETYGINAILIISQVLNGNYAWHSTNI
jgi:hypothetical protein